MTTATNLIDLGNNNDTHDVVSLLEKRVRIVTESAPPTSLLRIEQLLSQIENDETEKAASLAPCEYCDFLN